MNTHLKQLWAAMKLPEKLQKSYKFFCRGLDIRVTQTVKYHIRQTFSVYDFLHFVSQIALTERQSIGRCQNQIVIFIHISKCFYCFLLLFPQLRKKNSHG